MHCFHYNAGFYTNFLKVGDMIKVRNARYEKIKFTYSGPFEVIATGKCDQTQFKKRLKNWWCFTISWASKTCLLHENIYILL